jgi:hypothetical protein
MDISLRELVQKKETKVGHCPVLGGGVQAQLWCPTFFDFLLNCQTCLFWTETQNKHIKKFPFLIGVGMDLENFTEVTRRLFKQILKFFPNLYGKKYKLVSISLSWPEEFKYAITNHNLCVPLSQGGGSSKWANDPLLSLFFIGQAP